MRRSPAVLLPLLLLACSQGEQNAERASTGTEDLATPGLSVTAAPGVAFAYRYAFRLPPLAIARTQETHAQACEKLGPARCRVTGMRYRLLGENNIEAMLAFRLDPALARAFGKDGADLVAAAKGKLVDAEITGTDAGAEIGRLGTERARAADELRRLDGELAGARSAAERATLQEQRASVERRLAAADDGTTERRRSLATTPMTFDYAPGPAIRGFDAGAPFTSALDTAARSAQVTLAVLLGALAALGPPALALGLAWLLWRRFGRSWRERGAAPA